MPMNRQSPEIDGPASHVDLSNCDREPIHVIGRVQSFGGLISMSSDWIVNHASVNVHELIGVAAEDLIGKRLKECFSETAIMLIRSRMPMLASPDAVERVFGVELTADGRRFDLSIHLSGRSIVLEFEPRGSERDTNYINYVRPMVERISRAASSQQLCDDAARQLRNLIGFDRIMVYRFADDGTGVVVSESLKSGMDSFKGLHYPASDIPKQARALYKRNLLRIIADVSDAGAEIIPTVNPDGVPLDLSMSGLRSVSPIHLEYLANMGVQASLSISILKRGKLWGLFACHHESPRVLGYEMRTAAELFGQLFSFVLDQKEVDEGRDDQDRAQLLHDQLMAQLAEDASISENFDAIVDGIASVIPYDGAVGWVDGEFEAIGHTPTRDEFLGLVNFLNTTAASRIYHTDNLVNVYPSAADFVDRAAGMLVLPVSRAPRDYIVLFRRELAKSVTWAGNPDKPVVSGPHGTRLTPRKSFEAWQQIVRNTSAPWQSAEVRAAEALRLTLLEVILRMSDATLRERARAQEHQELLIAELNHRVRNILSLIGGLVEQSGAEARSISEFTHVVSGRIHALSRAHDLITQKQWEPASARELIRIEAEAYLGANAERVKIQGPDVRLRPKAFTALSLVIHELLTNSAKYGALSEANGVVQIAFAQLPDSTFSISWLETGGPPIQSPPVRRGFGSTIIERSIPYELGGRAEMKFEVTGVSARFEIPPAHVDGFSNTVQPEVGKAAAPQKRAGLTGHAMVLEDNLIIAMDAEDMLRSLGATEVFVASNVREALDFVETETLQFALLDVNLGSETSERVAEQLHAQGIPFAFATGYGDSIDLAKRFESTSVVKKPYDIASIEAALPG
jgi:light-regulated signal transduction histidine kinase (bacteriophytochrome)/CheY-like chemotaxis protein